jgi:hypothetical protein
MARSQSGSSKAMEYAIDIDAVWTAFCGTLPLDLQREAKALAVKVGLAPLAGVPWSNIFKNEVTLAAPALFATAMPQATEPMVTAATTAHMLAVIDAFATDRMLDHQATGGPQMSRLLEHVRRERDRAIGELTGSEVSPYRDAEYGALCAINTERILLQHGVALSLADYSYLSLAKQAVAFPASLALARAAGWNPRQERAIESTLRGIVLGLQFHDDAADWEDDWKKGGAWAVSLSRGLGVQDSASLHTKPSIKSIRALVHQSGALAIMMTMARWRYHMAARLAGMVRADRLSSWAREQEATVADLAKRESDSAGYVVRAHQLSGWAMEVLG